MLLHMRQCPKKWCKLGTVKGKFVLVPKTYVDLARKRSDWAKLGTIEKSVGLVPNLGAGEEVLDTPEINNSTTLYQNNYGKNYTFVIK